MIFDTHCHLGFGDDDARAVHERARVAGVTRLLDVGIDLESSRRARERAAELDGVAFAAGIHPNEAGRLDAEWPAVEALARGADCAAVGETGLDFYRDRAPRAQQERSFARHLELAIELDRPVVVHCRDAFAATFDVLRAHPGARGVLHCFSGGVDEARTALDLDADFHLSFAGPLTYPRSDALRAAAAFAPAERILVETDAPFLPPQDRRGQRNEPAFIVRTLEELARVRGVDFAEIVRSTSDNATRLFGVGG